MFDRLNQLDFSYRWVTRFFCLSKQDSIEELTKIKKGWYGKIKPLSAIMKEFKLEKPDFFHSEEKFLEVCRLWKILKNFSIKLKLKNTIQ